MAGHRVVWNGSTQLETLCRKAAESWSRRCGLQISRERLHPELRELKRQSRKMLPMQTGLSSERLVRRVIILLLQYQALSQIAAAAAALCGVLVPEPQSGVSALLPHAAGAPLHTVHGAWRPSALPSAD